jgi:hypothetical protein
VPPPLQHTNQIPTLFPRPPQLWLSLRDFTAASVSWTEEAVLDDDGGLLLAADAIRAEVEDYGARAHRATKAQKEVRARLGIPRCLGRGGV